MLEEGREIFNETRSWNPELNKTVTMRDKEVKNVKKTVLKKFSMI